MDAQVEQAAIAFRNKRKAIEARKDHKGWKEAGDADLGDELSQGSQASGRTRCQGNDAPATVRAGAVSCLAAAVIAAEGSLKGLAALASIASEYCSQKCSTCSKHAFLLLPSREGDQVLLVMSWQRHASGVQCTASETSNEESLSPACTLEPPNPKELTAKRPPFQGVFSSTTCMHPKFGTN